jgi:uncharacterized membrane protein YphA (DoxX/SURF4 family)
MLFLVMVFGTLGRECQHSVSVGTRLTPGTEPVALLTGGVELGGGFLLAAGLVTPLGRALLAAVMTVAILVVRLRRDIWAAAGGFEFPLLMLTSRLPVGIRNPEASSERRDDYAISASCRSLAERRHRRRL